MPSHSKQMTNSANNKPTSSVMKVKSKNKRRNRKKKKPKVQYPIHEMRKMTNKNANPTFNADANSNSKQNQMAVALMWAKTYETMIRLQFQHRIQYWRNLAINRNAEIQALKGKLELNDCTYDDVMESTDEDETNAGSNSQDNSEESEESESYLKFLEITLRHRQQRKRSLEKETDSN